MSFETIADIFVGYGEARILHEAVLAGVFDETRSARTADEVAEAVGWDADATMLLLDALAGMELLDKDGTRYVNADAADRYLTEDAEATLVPIIRFNAREWDHWGRLGEALETGDPVREPTMYQDDPVQLQDFIRGMESIARGRGDAERVVELLDLDGVERVLDLGCGPGTYSLAMLQARPDLEAVLFDLPGTLEITREMVASWPADVRDRVTVVAGDYREDPLPQADLAWVSNIVHSESPDTNRRLLAKIRDALPSGGRVVLKDHVLDASRTRPRAGSVFAITMLLFTGGRCYTEDEIRGWLTSADFERIRRQDVHEDGPQALVTAERP